MSNIIKIIIKLLCSQLSKFIGSALGGGAIYDIVSRLL